MPGGNGQVKVGGEWYTIVSRHRRGGLQCGILGRQEFVFTLERSDGSRFKVYGSSVEQGSKLHPEEVP